MLVHRRVTPSIKFACTHLYTWMERGAVRVKCLAQEHNTMSPARARTWTAQSGVERTNYEATVPPTISQANLIRNIKFLTVQFYFYNFTILLLWQHTGFLTFPMWKAFLSNFSILYWYRLPGGVLPIMAYTGRLHPKGVPFSGFRYIKG